MLSGVDEGEGEGEGEDGDGDEDEDGAMSEKSNTFLAFVCVCV